LLAVFVIVSLYFDVACTTLRGGLFAVAACLPQMKNGVNRRNVAGLVMYCTRRWHAVGSPRAEQICFGNCSVSRQFLRVKRFAVVD